MYLKLFVPDFFSSKCNKVYRLDPDGSLQLSTVDHSTS